MDALNPHSGGSGALSGWYDYITAKTAAVPGKLGKLRRSGAKHVIAVEVYPHAHGFGAVTSSQRDLYGCGGTACEVGAGTLVIAIAVPAAGVVDAAKTHLRDPQAGSVVPGATIRPGCKAPNGRPIGSPDAVVATHFPEIGGVGGQVHAGIAV
jgi:hypothetical protein